jgi:hypothetical protein
MKAFPYSREIPSDKEGYKAYVFEDGMDLRDYFAAKAMQELMRVALDENAPKENVAKTAYKIADAMMKAREVEDVY